jgi:hypothetical protein
MARVYGAYSSGGTNRFRVGYEIGAWSAVTSGSTTVSADFQFFVGNEFAVTSDLQTFDVTWTENGAGTLALGGITSPFQVQITSTSSSNSPSTTERNIGPVRTVTYTYGAGEYGSSPGNFTGTITGQGSGVGVNGFYTGGAATRDWTIAIPARPGGPPTVDSATAVGGIRSASMSWTASGDPGITSYTALRNGVTAVTVSGTTASDTGLGNNETASYTITATSPAGSGSRTTNSITTPSLPGTPGSLTANTSTFGTIGLSWSASSTTAGYGVTYTIDRTPGGTFVTSLTSYNDTTVAPSTAYTYTVTPSSLVGTGTTASISATSLGGVAKVWNGTSWVTILPKVWNGTAWVDAQARMWNGTSWVYGI